MFHAKQVIALKAIDSKTWMPCSIKGNEELVDLICSCLQDNFESWMDVLGKESADAQNLKQPITSSETLKNGGLKPASPVKYEDDIFLIVTYQNILDMKSRKNLNQNANIKPVAFLRMGKRTLFLQDEGQLTRVNDCLAALDFYSRIQRKGLGFLLLTHAVSKYGVDLKKIAFDRPTEAMLSFLTKHFPGLSHPTFHYNHFVTFTGFFQDSSPLM